MKAYTVTAYRWGQRANHSYVVGVFSDIERAKAAAEDEQIGRGGKYECEVVESEIDYHCGENFDNDPVRVIPLSDERPENHKRATAERMIEYQAEATSKKVSDLIRKLLYSKPMPGIQEILAQCKELFKEEKSVKDGWNKFLQTENVTVSVTSENMQNATP